MDLEESLVDTLSLAALKQWIPVITLGMMIRWCLAWWYHYGRPNL